MKHFNFRLQKYMNLKKQQEDVQRLVLFNARRAYDEERMKLAAIDRRIGDLLDYSATLRQERPDVDKLVFAESYHAFLVERKEMQALLVEDALMRLTAERERYLVLQKDRKLLERLREKAWQRFCQDYLSEEQKGLDEIGTSRYGHAGG
jgi:flagellar FliJ protein